MECYRHQATIVELGSNKAEQMAVLLPCRYSLAVKHLATICCLESSDNSELVHCSFGRRFEFGKNVSIAFFGEVEFLMARVAFLSWSRGRP